MVRRPRLKNGEENCWSSSDMLPLTHESHCHQNHGSTSSPQAGAAQPHPLLTMQRISIQITGAQGQGINSVGEMCAKGLKRAGYCIFGYREYASLIKGGHSSYQLDISDVAIESSETMVDILICFNHHGLERNTREVKPGGIILHQTPQWTFPPATEEKLKKQNITVMYLPSEDIIKRLKGKPILGNVLVTSVVWALLGREPEGLKEFVKEQFGHKGADLLKLNYACIDEGFAYKQQHAPTTHVYPPPPNVKH